MEGIGNMEILRLVIVCMIGIISFVGLTTGLISLCSKKSGKIPKIFLGELDNTDYSIDLVVQNLRLTNGIERNGDYHNIIKQRIGKHDD